MEQHYIELAETYLQTNDDVKTLWEDHKTFARQVEKLMHKPFLTPNEKQTLNQLKKQKLENKTQLTALLDRLGA